MSTRRKVKTCLTLKPENVDFVHERVIPARAEFGGAFTKALAALIRMQLDGIGNQIPKPPFSNDRFDLERVDITLEPHLMRNLDWIVSEWQTTDKIQSHNRSEVVDYLITLTREQVEEAERQQREDNEE